MVTLCQLRDPRITVTTDNHKVPENCGQGYATLSTELNKAEKMAEKKVYSFNGKMVAGETVTFESTTEPFAQYTLSDGTSVKVKMIMLDAVRLDSYSDQGDPMYQFQFQQVIAVVAPESLKKKAN